MGTSICGCFCKVLQSNPVYIMCYKPMNSVLRWQAVSNYATQMGELGSSSKFPTITIPLRVQAKIQRNLAERQKREKVEKSRLGKLTVPVISCRQSNFNYYLGQSYGKFATVSLASKSWKHRKSNGDFFTITCHGRNPSFLPSDEDAGYEKMVLRPDIIHALQAMGFKQPTNIQVASAVPLLKGQNTLIASETGSGKTIAYLAPLIQHVLKLKITEEGKQFSDFNAPLAIIVCPSRELAEQIQEVVSSLTSHLGEKVTSRAVIGGRLKKQMLNPDVRDVDILIGSLGALSKLTTTGVYSTKRVAHIVLDEADTLLDDSFSNKLSHYMKRFMLQAQISDHGQGPLGVQVTLVGATIPTSMSTILEDIVPLKTFVKVTTPYLHRLLPHVPQKFLRMAPSAKPARLLQLIKSDTNRGVQVIVFSNKSSTCDWISLFLNENGIETINLNGNMAHIIRVGRFDEYQSGKVKVLSCTDIASRGLDTQTTQHVINYDCPGNLSDYIHRCGRTGRVGAPATGHVTSFICNSMEAELVQTIEFATRKVEVLPNVNSNIARLIEAHFQRKNTQLPQS